MIRTGFLGSNTTRFRLFGIKELPNLPFSQLDGQGLIASARDIDILVNRDGARHPFWSMAMKSGEAIRKGPGLVAFAAASLLLIPCAGTCAAQSVTQTTRTAPPSHGYPNSKTTGSRHKAGKRSANNAKPESPPSPSTEAASPPQVKLDKGTLTVDAHNSDLSAILQDVAQKSGMSIDGLSRNTRVFGVYGPGAPRDVLSQLLTGAGYNFVMVGGGNGNVPRKLVLTAQNNNAPLSNPASTRPSAASAYKGGEHPDSEDNDQEPLGPGAIAHPSPQDTDQTDDDTRMQQRLDNLRRMQQTIQQQQQQQNPQQ